MLTPAPHNFEPRFNVCPTTTIDTIIAPEGQARAYACPLGIGAELVEYASYYNGDTRGYDFRNGQVGYNDAASRGSHAYRGT
jgi:hypothetical protein